MRSFETNPRAGASVVAGHQLRVGLSIGVAIFSTDGTNAAMLQANADAALMHRHAVEYSTYPRGPRSGPGCNVPVRHHLIGPIRPTRGRSRFHRIASKRSQMI